MRPVEAGVCHVSSTPIEVTVNEQRDKLQQNWKEAYAEDILKHIASFR